MYQTSELFLLQNVHERLIVQIITVRQCAIHIKQDALDRLVDFDLAQNFGQLDWTCAPGTICVKIPLEQTSVELLIQSRHIIKQNML